MSSDKRRTFLKQVGGLAAVAAAAKTASAAPAPQEIFLPPGPTRGPSRSYTGSNFALELDGEFAGWVQSTEGGAASAEVVVEPPGPDMISRKHISNVKYEDITVKCDAAMSKAVYNWISDTLAHKFTRKDGAILIGDRQLREVSRLSFFEALLTEIGMPACDAESKEPAYMTFKFSPEYTQKTPGFPGRQMPRAEQKRWLASNFKFSIDGMNTSRVSKVDGFTIKQVMKEGDIGDQRDYKKEPASLEVPNLVVTFPETGAEDFHKWHEDFVVKGNCGQEDEKGGTLTFLTPNTQQPLFTLSFGNMGIFRLTPEMQDAGSDTQHKWQAEIYAEEIKFDAHKS